MIKNALAYSRMEFDKLVTDRGIDKKDNIAIVSIVSENDPNPQFTLEPSYRVIDVRFDDCDPYEFCEYDSDVSDFSYYSEWLGKYVKIHCLDGTQADMIVRRIDEWANDSKIDTIIVHCSAGASRSQGIVRYIHDTYSTEDYEVKARTDNPCDTPNYHVVSMLKRARMMNFAN
jgi:predicted protein tyrosine phosphatase